MAFSVKDWKDFPDTSTPITAAALEDLEARVAAYADALAAGLQPADADLLAIAGLSTTSYGRALLALADAAALRTAAGLGTAATHAHGDYDAAGAAAAAQAASQPLDSDLTAIAGIAPSNDDVIQRKTGVWVARSMAQIKTDLALAASDVGLGSVTNDAQIPKSLGTTKGDTIAFTGSGVPVRKAVGANGKLVTADSSTSDGLAYADTGVRLPSGLYVPLIASVNGTQTPTKNREYCMGFYLAPQTIDRLAIRVNNTPDTGAVIRFGIRADLAGQPGTPQVDQTLAADGGAAWKALSFSYVHPGGILWLTWTSQNWTTTGPVLDGAAGGSTPPVGAAPYVVASGRAALDTANGHTVPIAYQDSVSGALGSTFTNAATVNQPLITIHIRRA